MEEIYRIALKIHGDVDCLLRLMCEKLDCVREQLRFDPITYGIFEPVYNLPLVHDCGWDDEHGGWGVVTCPPFTTYFKGEALFEHTRYGWELEIVYSVGDTTTISTFRVYKGV